MSQLFSQGGWVLAAIGLVSFVAWLLIVWKTFELVHEKWWGFGWAHDALVRLRSGKRSEVQEECRQRSGVVGRAMLYGLESSIDRSDFDRHYRPYLESESLRLHRFLPMIAVLASVLPLLGLLGTVIGMVATFDSIVDYGGAEPAALAEGISQALITTKAGLFTALPVYLCHGFLVSRANRCVDTATMFAKKVHSCRQEGAVEHV